MPKARVIPEMAHKHGTLPLLSLCPPEFGTKGNVSYTPKSMTIKYIPDSITSKTKVIPSNTSEEGFKEN